MEDLKSLDNNTSHKKSEENIRLKSKRKSKINKYMLEYLFPGVCSVLHNLSICLCILKFEICN